MQPALLGLHGAPQLIVWQRSHRQQSSIMWVVLQDKAVMLCSMAHCLQLTGSTSNAQRINRQLCCCTCSIAVHALSTASWSAE